MKKCITYIKIFSKKRLISDPVEKVTLACSNLAKSIDYWNGILGLKIFGQSEKNVLLGFKESEAKLELQEIGKFFYVDHIQ